MDLIQRRAKEWETLFVLALLIAVAVLIVLALEGVEPVRSPVGTGAATVDSTRVRCPANCKTAVAAGMSPREAGGRIIHASRS
jgi:hypothetical protein